MKQSLFIGRFQPFHLGHLSVVKTALKENDRLIIGIGSAEDNFLPENPFTASERFQMIEETLHEEGIRSKTYRIIPVRNINDYALWPGHVDLLVPPYENVYTGSEIVKKLFTEQGKHKVIDIKKDLDICSTDIREKMLNDGNWEAMVHPRVAELIKKWDGPKRLKEIN